MHGESESFKAQSAKPVFHPRTTPLSLGGAVLPLVSTGNFSIFLLSAKIACFQLVHLMLLSGKYHDVHLSLAILRCISAVHNLKPWKVKIFLCLVILLWMKGWFWPKQSTARSCLDQTICWSLYLPLSKAALSGWLCIFSNTKRNATIYRRAGAWTGAQTFYLSRWT